MVHALNGQADGASPIDLLAGNDGNLYGVSAASGINSKVFRVTLPGDQFSAILTLPSPDKERSPLTQSADGTLFGTYFVEEGGLGPHLFQVQPDGSGFQDLGTFLQLAGIDDTLPALFMGSEPTSRTVSTTAASTATVSNLLRRGGEINRGMRG